MWRLSAAIVAVEKQWVFDNPSACKVKKKLIKA